MATDNVVVRFSDVTFEYEYGDPALVHLVGSTLRLGSGQTRLTTGGLGVQCGVPAFLNNHA